MAGVKPVKMAGLAALALALACVAAFFGVAERAARSPRALLQDEALWTPRGYGPSEPQGYGQPYPAWSPGMYPIPPTQEAAAKAHAPEFVPYLRYKEYLENVLDAKMASKRAERDELASRAYQEAADAARERQGWLDDYEAQKKIRQREAWEKHLSGPAPEGWKAAEAPLLTQKMSMKPVKQQQLFSVQDLQDAGDSEAEAMMDPSHPDGFWGKWVDGPRPDGDNAATMRVPKRSTSKLSRPHAKHAMPHHITSHRQGLQPFGSKGLPLASQMFHRKGSKQSLASVDLGEESDAEALMDPSHPSGPWGTWVEPSTSAKSVIGEKQYQAYVGDSSGLGNLLDRNSAKGLKQSLAAVDLGEESDAEALMDPSHPSGPWGTWVEPSTSARSVIGEKQYQTYVGDSSGLGNLLDRNSAKGLKQSLANVDLGAETYSEALMDPSHPSGPWGTWVEPGSEQASGGISGLYGGRNNMQETFENGQAALAAAVAKGDHNGFGMDSPTGLGGRFGGRTGGTKADEAESFVFGRLLDSSTA